MTGRVLVAVPEPPVRDAIASALGREGLAVEASSDGGAALERARMERFAMVILDLDGPAGRGIERCRQLRSSSDVPLVVLSARDSAADRVFGLEAGADDYVGKPFAMAELVSRVRALLRRRQLDAQPPTAIRRVGDVEIDTVRHRVTVAGTAVDLTPTEFRLLALLATQPGRAFSANEILHHLWNCDYVGPAGACKAHISNLRRKVEDDPAQPRRVVTVRGAGYTLAPRP
jgi:DNA-binding response OmpR family regulator